MTTTQNKSNDLLTGEGTQVSDRDISKETIDSSLVSESSTPIVRSASTTSTSTTSSYKWSVKTYEYFIEEEYLEETGWDDFTGFKKNQQITMKKNAKTQKGSGKNEWITATEGNSSQKIDGGAGNDILSGCQGDDVLLGGKGNDILNSAIYKGATSGQVGKGEIDNATGGQGEDIYVVADEYYGNYYGDYWSTEEIYADDLTYYGYDDVGEYEMYVDEYGNSYSYDEFTGEYYYFDEFGEVQSFSDSREVTVEDEGCLVIDDFSVEEDKLQLFGSKEQYYTKEEYTRVSSSYYEYGVGVYDVTTNDLVCFLEDSASTPTLRSAGGGKLDLDKIAVFV